MRLGGFGAEVEKLKAGFCPFCYKPISIDEFRDPLSRREYQISGVCQSCQDDFFGSDEEKTKKEKVVAEHEQEEWIQTTLFEFERVV